MKKSTFKASEDEEKDPDDLMEHEKPKPQIDFSKIDPKNPESVLQMSKKGQTLMMFVSLSGSPTRDESEKLTQLWQDQLFNANFQLQRYIIADDRALFMVTDGSKAWEIKNFLVDQKQCKDVTIEGQVYNGRGSGKPIDNKPRPAGMDDEGEDKKGKKEKKKKGSKKTKSNDVNKKKKPSVVKDKDEAARIKANKAGFKKDLHPDPKDNMVLLSEEEAEMLQKGKEEL
ncbi:LDLR chaperone boca-like [Amphiura filiformis]|uniref:LDLR chaperone boca-like n=1 Tax=Amphiura filiformis TaxID=82378 RepID=UPI003B20BE33